MPRVTPWSDILVLRRPAAWSRFVVEELPQPDIADLGPVELRAAAERALRAGERAVAVDLMLRSEAPFSGDTRFLVQLGNLLRQQGRRLDALSRLRRAAQMDPNAVAAQTALAICLYELGALEQALHCAQRAIELDAQAPLARYTEALVLIEQLRLSEAIASLRHLLQHTPAHRQALSTLLYLLNLAPDLDPAAVAAEHCSRAGRCYPTEPRPQAPPVPGGRLLRIGFLSADLRDHPVGKFLEPLLDRLDRRRFISHAYSTGGSDDVVGKRLRQSAQHWFDCQHCSDEALEARLRSDQLDLLIDLSGHTQGQRLAVMARRPAPRQACWLGYPNTSGIDGIDFRVVDDVLVPPESTLASSEQLIRLKGPFACFRPESTAPLPDRRPDSPMVFGSLHRLEKINDYVIGLWAELLRGLPGARLLLARDQLDPRRQRWLAQKFTAAGVHASRLDMRRLDADVDSHLGLFNEIDVMLDVFPWSGHTLACEALWMGVPVVTLRGNSIAGRLSCSALHAAGCADWIATGATDYLRIARSLAAQVDALRTQREDLRRQVANSLLTDEHAFARAFGEAIEHMIGAVR